MPRKCCSASNQGFDSRALVSNVMAMLPHPATVEARIEHWINRQGGQADSAVWINCTALENAASAKLTSCCHAIQPSPAGIRLARLYSNRPENAPVLTRPPQKSGGGFGIFSQDSRAARPRSCSASKRCNSHMSPLIRDCFDRQAVNCCHVKNVNNNDSNGNIHKSTRRKTISCFMEPPPHRSKTQSNGQPAHRPVAKPRHILSLAT